MNAAERLLAAARVVGDCLDLGERDPTRREAEEFELAAIAYARSLRSAPQGGCRAICERSDGEA